MWAGLSKMRVSPRFVDVMITIAVYVATAYPTLERSGPWYGLPMATLASVPLLWRRKAPVTVAFITGFGTTILAFAKALPDLPYGQLVSTYTFAELSPPLLRLLSVGVTIAGVLISLAVPHEGPATLGYTGLAFVTAYALGIGVRARHERIELLEERTRRLTEEQLAAAAQERSRIARDMHDVLAHSVSLIVLQAEGGAAIAQADPGRAVTAFDTIAETGREALVQLRHTLGVLRESNSGTEPIGLAALAALVARTRQAGLDVAFDGSPDGVSSEVGVTVYRVVQEALTNVVKHAGASRVSVSVGRSPAGVEVSVVDDGKGFSGGRGGHGLIGMRERVEACGGSLATGPGPGGTGFRVKAVIPHDAARSRR
jgi:signal transduction histidine kinase